MQPVATTPSLKKWNWPLTKVYNGFSPHERIRGWQVSRWVQAIGYLDKPSQCGICQTTERACYHNENYYTPWQPYAVCASCHYAIHNRFNRPWLLQNVIKKFGAGVGGWLAELSPEPHYNLAAMLRDRDGQDIIHIHKYLPDGLSDIFPFEQLHPWQGV